MKTRETKRECPDSPHYFTAELSTGVHHFRVPCGPKGLRALQVVGASGLAILETMSETESRVELVGNLLALPGDSLAGLAACVGLGWAHETQDLETPKGRDLVVYGEGVWEELEDAGYPFREIVITGALILSRILAAVDVDREELAKLDFFGRKPAQES